MHEITFLAFAPESNWKKYPKQATPLIENSNDLTFVAKQQWTLTGHATLTYIHDSNASKLFDAGLTLTACLFYVPFIPVRRTELGAAL